MLCQDVGLATAPGNTILPSATGCERVLVSRVKANRFSAGWADIVKKQAPQAALGATKYVYIVEVLLQCAAGSEVSGVPKPCLDGATGEMLVQPVLLDLLQKISVIRVRKLICTFAHLHICTNAHLHICTFAHLHICTTPVARALALCLSDCSGAWRGGRPSRCHRTYRPFGLTF
jgi:hypothetical protein